MSIYEAGSGWAGAASSGVEAHCMSTENSKLHGEALGHDDRWRELFPLPLCPEVPRKAGLSVSARRRRATVRSRVESVNSIIKTLNEMYSPSRDGDFSSSFVRTRAQEACQHELFRAVANTKPPSKVLSMREAVQESKSFCEQTCPIRARLQLRCVPMTEACFRFRRVATKLLS